ncbi:hypothetical protein C8Q74DRAFT_1371896 [Fomes fomentarius]|nr:hypothetical protein C8Q74DRAFT_1371896 [Fomes fomentarius]
MLPLCTTPPAHTPPLTHADFPALIAIQHRALDELYLNSAIGLDLVLNIKHAELAARDLVIIVKSSDLSSKDALADVLTGFLSDARLAARDLQVFTSKLYGILDSLLAFNTYALRAIESVREPTAKPGLTSPLGQALVRTFESSLLSFTAAISTIILDATTTSSSLDRLEERLATAHALTVQEAFDNALALDDLLWELWTRLGGNRHKLRDLRNRETTLKQVQQCRNVAVAYVATAMHTLTVLEVEVSELRDRLSTSAMEAIAVPFEVQLASIEASVYRMKEESLTRRGGSLEHHHGGQRLIDGGR